MASVYVTPADVRAALADNSGGGNDDASGAYLSDEQIATAILNAGSQVDGALAVRYSLPLPAPVPQLVLSLATDIAAYLATLTWRRGRPLPDKHPVQARYDRVTALLADLAAGKLALPVAESTPSNGSAWNVAPDYFWLGSEFFPDPWTGPVEEDGSGPGSMASVAALAMDRVVLAREPDILFEGPVTRSPDGAALSAAVRWPDGSPGAYSGTESLTAPGFVDTWTLTYGQLPVINTYVQPLLTRDGSGRILDQPAIAAS